MEGRDRQAKEESDGSELLSARSFLEVFTTCH